MQAAKSHDGMAAAWRGGGGINVANDSGGVAAYGDGVGCIRYQHQYGGAYQRIIIISRSWRKSGSCGAGSGVAA